MEDFDARLATATAAVRAEKEASDALAASRAEEIETLKASLAAAEAATEKMKNIGLNWKRRTESLDTQFKAERATHQEALDAKDKELGEVEAQIEQIQGELEAARTELREGQKQLEESRRAEALKEGTVQRLQSELNAARVAKPGAPGAPAAAQNDAALVSSLYSSQQSSMLIRGRKRSRPSVTVCSSVSHSSSRSSRPLRPLLRPAARAQQSRRRILRSCRANTTRCSKRRSSGTR